jgi:hypothetical protein
VDRNGTSLDATEDADHKSRYEYLAGSYDKVEDSRIDDQALRAIVKNIEHLRITSEYQGYSLRQTNRTGLKNLFVMTHGVAISDICHWHISHRCERNWVQAVTMAAIGNCVRIVRDMHVRIYPKALARNNIIRGCLDDLFKRSVTAKTVLGRRLWRNTGRGSFDRCRERWLCPPRESGHVGRHPCWGITHWRHGLLG